MESVNWEAAEEQERRRLAALEAVAEAARAFRVASDPDMDNYPYAGFSVVGYEVLCEKLDALDKEE